MLTPISAARHAPLPEIRPPEHVREPGRAGEFGGLLRDTVARVEGLRAGSGEAISRMLAGEGAELHQVALAVQQAELSFELFLQVRNKVVQAYQEVMRMQV
jgi:flagellar hook-basal body complex protein FliE